MQVATLAFVIALERATNHFALYLTCDMLSGLLNLPYRVVFAVVTLHMVYLFDTEQPHPLALFANLHYEKLTDASWYVSPQPYSLSC